MQLELGCPLCVAWGVVRVASLESFDNNATTFFACEAGLPLGVRT